MYLISDQCGRYIKTTASKMTLTTNENLADNFFTLQEAMDYINNHIVKKKRHTYSPVEIRTSTPKLLPKRETSNVFDRVRISLGGMLQEELNELEKQLDRYDNIILDIRHYIRDENTKVNAAQGFVIFRKMQEVERERAKCKHRLTQLQMLQGSIDKQICKAESFEYEEYKPRVVADMDRFLRGEV